MNELSVSDVLERAADALWMYGRTKGTGMAPDGTMCVHGAVCHVRGLDPSNPANIFGRWDDALNALDRYLAQNRELLRPGHDMYFATQLSEGRFPCFVWSDCEPDDALVIDTLKRCAKEIRNAEAGS